MGADIDRNDLLLLNGQLQGNPISDFDRYGMEFTQSSLQPVQAQGRMKGIDLQKFQGLFVLGRFTTTPLKAGAAEGSACRAGRRRSGKHGRSHP